jgi:hypothetical protein
MIDIQEKCHILLLGWRKHPPGLRTASFPRCIVPRHFQTPWLRSAVLFLDVDHFAPESGSPI